MRIFEFTSIFNIAAPVENQEREKLSVSCNISANEVYAYIRAIHSDVNVKFHEIII